MSRIGKLPIVVPKDVDVNFNGVNVTVTGKFGSLHKQISKAIEIEQQNEIIKINVVNNSRNTKALHGLYRTLINNMIVGVSEQFSLTLLLKGVGYRAVVQGQKMVLSLGYSHPVEIKIPEYISVEVIKNTTIYLKSCDKELLGLFASNIRAWRKPEPYKGKGIMYQNELIIRKVGKSGK